ncbi:hypothetical protein KIH27_15870 [Mycobacterium sp. M1]|uniref:Uncharacterized protein n=1 Tax=Mycolicibacter acidiphilus TaxID=2835306 RepID=A0ABS5RL76_9MYCO|nr:hypothetical protein [Mycolicibacter acidiphilus]MBS9535065.1 hypothetical protein [Mycolicibacter acidiphilus]
MNVITETTLTASGIVNAALDEMEADVRTRLLGDDTRTAALYELLTIPGQIDGLTVDVVRDREDELLEALESGVQEALDGGAVAEDYDGSGGLIQFGIGAALEVLEDTKLSTDEIEGLAESLIGDRAAFRVTEDGDEITVKFAELVTDFNDEGYSYFVPHTSLDEFRTFVMDNTDSGTVEVSVSVFMDKSEAEDAITQAYTGFRVSIDDALDALRDESVDDLNRAVKAAAAAITADPEARDDYPTEGGTWGFTGNGDDLIVVWVMDDTVYGEAYPPHASTPAQPHIEPWALDEAEIA